MAATSEMFKVESIMYNGILPKVTMIAEVLNSTIDLELVSEGLVCVCGSIGNDIEQVMRVLNGEDQKDSEYE